MLVDLADKPAVSPVRWPQPGELWSWWDMLEAISALEMLRVGEAVSRLEELYTKGSFYEKGREEEHEETKVHFKRMAFAIAKLDEFSVSDSLYELADEPPKDFELPLFVIKQCEKVLKRKSLLILAPGDIDYIHQIQAFGIEVSQAFPSSEYEIEDAGTCIALGQNTAAVFHLMRALEPALIAFADEFGVKFKDHWNSALDKIEEAVRDRENIKNRPNWAVEKDYWIDVATHFFHVKNAWRNYTMHNKLRYDREKAIEIYNDSKRFMQKLAVRLKE